ncbi:hypothetical protein J2W28_005952 [Variovorax boronicumulans]|nr:hypothetical protein [Variovorax boronicumulans]MDQ0006779.1 hypothetical protein [Variovorax boronicumulans]
MPDGGFTGTTAHRDTAFNAAKAAATRVGKKFAMLVTESPGCTWQSLEEV